ncbi:glycosyltransferase family 1 protein [Rhodococcus sp. 14C212]|uniref:glycosyltransferase n=1 Tax=Rhodococcus sp. 14C212 TaxID=2711209 RepID=UPI0013EE3E96|nr:glycosyltransferase [Rhodococcus sp. 14C212]NGP08939.1 glycosyltransferase family 1 protein [Rhodococcus sp. 14C212]
MKIAMVSEHAGLLAALGDADSGGRDVHVAELSAALVRAGHDVTVYTRRDDPDLPERVRTEDGYEVVHVPAGPATRLPTDEVLPRMGELGTFLAHAWTKDRPDVAHAHFWMSGIATQLAARNAKVPTVQTFHTLGVVERRHQGSADAGPSSRIHVERLLALGASRVAATCSDEVFELATLGLPRTRTSVVPCGVNLELFTPIGPEDPARGSGHRLVTVGPLVPRMGFDIAIRALALLPDTELVIAGGPVDGNLADEAARLRAVAEQHGVQDRVRMPGPVPRKDMPALLRSADVVVCTPWYEPLGIVPLEAMACGRPVVATAVGGLLDTVVDGVTGTLVPPHAPEAVAAAVHGLLTDDVQRTAFGLAGHDRASTRYSWDRSAADAVRTYERCVPEPRQAVRSTRSGAR